MKPELNPSSMSAPNSATSIRVNGSGSRRSISSSPRRRNRGSPKPEYVRHDHTSSGQLILATLLRQNSSPTNNNAAVSSGTKSPLNNPRRLQQFTNLLETEPDVSLDDLRKLSWSGISSKVRAHVWLLLAGVLPTANDRQQHSFRKRVKGYLQLTRTQYDMDNTQRTPQMQNTLRQIKLDVPRTNPDMPIFQHPRIQKALERILFVWAVRNPATGYVQGINDLATPFLLVFLARSFDGDFERVDVDALSEEQIIEAEASSFLCLSKISEGIQDNYIFAQPGIQRMLYRLEELIKRIDSSFHNHLKTQGLQYVQFAFRWFNCFLIREVPLTSVIRLWDTYLSDESGTGYSQFHVYVCAALLMRFAHKIKELEFQDMVMYLQHLPTAQLSSREIDSILSQAFVYQSLFANSPSHLQQQ